MRRETIQNMLPGQKKVTMKDNFQNGILRANWYSINNQNVKIRFTSLKN